MTYPVSGIFVKFLTETYGVDKFLELYKKYSGSDKDVERIQIDIADLPDNIEWKNYLNKYADPYSIKVSGINKSNFTSLVTENENVTVLENDNSYLIKVRNSIGVMIHNEDKYQSNLFSELFPARKYNGEKYIITANAGEVSVYNLFTNNLIAKYVSGFAADNKAVCEENGLYVFEVSKEVFDEDLSDMIFSNL